MEKSLKIEITWNEGYEKPKLKVELKEVHPCEAVQELLNVTSLINKSVVESIEEIEKEESNA